MYSTVVAVSCFLFSMHVWFMANFYAQNDNFLFDEMPVAYNTENKAKPSLLGKEKVRKNWSNCVIRLCLMIFIQSAYITFQVID